jgi:hypothetical protein
LETSAAGQQGTDTAWRVLAVFLCLALLFGCAVMVIAMGDIAGTKICSEVTNAYALAHPGGSCFSGSSFQKTVSLALGFSSGTAAGVAGLLMLGFVITGRRVRIALVLAVAAIVLGGLSILIGSL